MAEFVIPCETIVRLAKLIADNPADIDPSFATMRLEDNMAIVTNRQLMAVERITTGQGLLHLVLSPELLDQCATEANFAGSLTINANEIMNFATCSTTFGWQPTTNVGYYAPVAADWSRWRELITWCREPAQPANVGMLWNVENLVQLANVSPSGSIYFESVPTGGGPRPTLIRDAVEPDWIGIFRPYTKDHSRVAATVPDWFPA